MRATGRMLFLVLLFSLLAAGAEAAGRSKTVASSDEQQELKARVEVIEKKLEKQDEESHGKEEELDDYAEKFKHFDRHLLHREIGPPTFICKGFRIGIDGTFIGQGAHNANFGNEQNPLDASFSSDITFGKIFKDITGKAFLHLEAGAGAGVENNLDLFSNVNADIRDDNAHIKVTELWYQQGIGNIFLFSLGEFDPTVYFDFNNVADDETTQFLGRIFRSNPTIEFPIETIGLRLMFAPGDLFELDYGVFIANPTLSDINGRLFNIGQFTFMSAWGGLEGNYRFLAWYSNVSHTKWSNPASTHNSDYGFGLSLDQQIIGALTLFARYGWKNPAVYNPAVISTSGANYTVGQSWSGGFQVSGSLWGRESDVVAVAVGQNFPSSDYRNANPGYRGRAEGHLEVYYNFHLNKHLALSPDYQMIWNPFGGDGKYGDRIVSVYGLRAEIDM